eukprot:TRINITY_DN15974_c0_g1_i3.p2 TRINITY_DN15974_c0_g1~~TRINITY_DN15974_c0_g1_i3.p2  ORF type:complete len:112 (-),score=20.17 TRINITY_DN15974_c0_g1_i3:217-552(-)
MGKCTINTIDLPNGSTSNTGVFVERCRYLEASKCAGICVHTCKIPTQSFMKESMGVPLYMEPNFNDFSCQFKFGIEPPSIHDDKSLEVACLEICPTNMERKSINKQQCPKV